MSTSAEPKWEDLRLVQVQTILRHGLRVPLSVGPYTSTLDWQCQHDKDHNLLVFKQNEPHDYRAFIDRTQMLGTCYVGQLSKLGRQRIREVGQAFRKHYIDKLHFLKASTQQRALDGTHVPAPEDGELWIRSTDSERTIETAWEFTQGLFGRTGDDEPVLATVHVVEPETMYPNSCPQLSASLRTHKSATSAYAEGRQQVKEHFEQSPMSEEDKKYFARRAISGLCPSLVPCLLMNLIHFQGNTLTILREHGHKYPSGITEESLSLICNVSGLDYFNTYSPRNHAILAIGRFVQQLDRQFVQKINKDLGPTPTARDPKVDAKFLLYTGHDNTIGPLLNAFNVRKIYDKKHPGMGSNVSFELYQANAPTKSEKDYFLRILYNMQPVKLPWCEDREICAWTRVHHVMESLSPQDFEALCKIPEKL